MSSFAPYERYVPLGEQSKRNIGEGRVLKGLIRRGEMPVGTTLEEARAFEVNLARRPRKGVRKKGLLPEMLKKDYKITLGKKIKEFSRVEKRIYDALAQREKRGYVPRPVDDFALELENFLEEEEGGIEEVIEDAPPMPLEVAIPQGENTSLSILPVVFDNPDTDEESEFDDDDGDWISGAVDVPPPARPIAKRRPSRKNIVYLSAQELRDYANDYVSEYDKQQRVMEITMGWVRQDPEEARLRDIRDREESRKRKEEKRALKLLEEERLASELEDFLEEEEEEEVVPLKEELVSTIEEVRESRRRLGLPPDPLTEAQLRELSKDEFKKPVKQAPPPFPEDVDAFIKDIEDRGKPISQISPISKHYDSDESLEGSDFDLDPEVIEDEDLNLTDEELEEDEEELQLRRRIKKEMDNIDLDKIRRGEILAPTDVWKTEYEARLTRARGRPLSRKEKKRPPPSPSAVYDPTPDPPSLFNYPAPILPRSRRHQVPTWATASRRSLSSATIFKDIPIIEGLSMENKLDDFLKSQGRELEQPQVDEAYDVGFVLEDPIRPRIHRREKQFGITRQRRVAIKPDKTTKQLLQEAGVGKLSLGGAKKSYRLKDFEARERKPNPQGIPVLQMLLKNNRNRMKK